jgi:N-acetylneuraminic acid mutarotase
MRKSWILYFILLWTLLYSPLQASQWKLIPGDGSSVASFLSQNSQVQRIWGWDRGEWRVASTTSTPALTSWTPLVNMETCKGYWVEMSDSQASLSNPPSVSCSLPANFSGGWSLLAGNGDSVSLFLAEHPEVEKIWNFEDHRFCIGAAKGDIRNEAYCRFDTLEESKAYWIQASWKGAEYEAASFGIAPKDQAAARFEDKIYFQGGTVSSQAGNYFQVYSIPQNRVLTDTVAGMARSDHTAVAYDSKIWFFGGRDNQSQISNHFEYFDTVSQTWHSVTAAMEGRFGHSAIVYDNKMHIWGGYSTQIGTETNLLTFDFVTGSWSSRVTSGVARIHHSASLLQDKLIIWGGTAADMEILDLADYSIKKYAGEVASRQEHNSFVFEDRVWFIGGIDGTYHTVSKVDVYDLQTNSWWSPFSLNESCYSHNGSIYGGRYYYHGGVDELGVACRGILGVVLDATRFSSSSPSSPQMKLVTVQGNSNDIAFHYDLIDADGDCFINLSGEYSLNSGIDWTAMSSVSGDSQNVIVGTGKTLVWKSSVDISNDQPDVRLRFYIDDGSSKASLYTLSGPVAILNGLPEVSSLVAKGEVGNYGNIRLNYYLKDGDGENLSLKLDYSLNSGNNWLSTTHVTGITSSLSSCTGDIESSCFHTLVWNSLQDISSHEEYVRIRLTAFDSRNRMGISSFTQNMSIYNGLNTIPVIDKFEVLGNGGQIPLLASIRDNESNRIDLQLAYLNPLCSTSPLSCTSGLENFIVSTAVIGITSNLLPGENISFWWDSSKEISSDLTGVKLLLTASDGRMGTPTYASSISDIFAVYNSNDPPKISTFAAEVLTNSRVEVSFAVTDKESSPCSVELQYLLTAGGDWVSIHPTHLQSSSKYWTVNTTHSLLWDPSQDFLTNETSVQVRIRALDSKEVSDWQSSGALEINNQGQWSILNTGITSRAYPVMVEDDGRIYIWGAQEGLAFSNRLDIYNVAEEKWESAKDGGKARIGAAGGIYNKKLYIWGGFSQNTANLVTNYMDIYDIESNSWESGFSTGEARMTHCMVVSGGKLWIHGGQKGDSKGDNTLQVYDISSRSWSIFPKPSKYRRFAHSMLADQGKFYVWGGFSSDFDNSTASSMEIFDSLTGKWHTGIPGGAPRAWHASVVDASRLYFFGGLDTSLNFAGDDSQIKYQMHDTVDVYDIQTMNWQTFPNPHLPRIASGAASSFHKIFLWGGFDKNSNASNALLVYKEASTPLSFINTAPLIHNLRINGTLGKLDLFYDLKDNDPVDITVELSFDKGRSWQELTRGLSGALNQVSEGFNKRIVWDTTQYFSSDVYNIRIRLLANDGKGRLSTPLVSEIFDVYNNQSNTAPAVSFLGLQGERNNIVFSIRTSDAESNPVGVHGFYSVAGSNWMTATSIKDHEIASCGIRQVIWESDKDVFITTSVRFRFVPYDLRANASSAVTTQSHSFTLENGNASPVLSNLAVSGSKIDINLFFNIYDGEGDPVDLLVEWSVDKELWSTCSLSGTTKALTTNSSSLVWHSLQDFAKEGRVYVRITPSDNKGEGTSVVSNSFLLKNENWSRGISSSQRRFGHSSVVYNNKMYVWGGLYHIGEDEDKKEIYLNRMDIYDFGSGRWSQGQTGGYPRAWHTANVMGTKIYFWGGKDDKGILNTFDIYDMRTNTWTTGTAGGTPRFAHSSIVYNNKIWYYGGETFGGSILNTLCVYDILSDVWSVTYDDSGVDKPLAGGTQRRDHRAVLYDDKMWLVGGYYRSGLDDIFVKDIDVLDLKNINLGQSITSRFSSITADIQRAGHSVVVLDGSFYLWGGYSSSGILNTMKKYNPDANSWEEIDAGGVGRKYHCAVEFNGFLYMHGGFAQGEVLPTVDIYTIPRMDSVEESAFTSSNLDFSGISQGRSGFSMQHKNGKFYVWGGNNGSAYVNTMGVYDVKNGSWSAGVSGGTSCIYASSSLIGNKIIYVGGKQQNGVAQGRVDIFDVDSQSWSSGSSSIYPRYGHSAFVYNGKVYAWGGYNNGLNSIYETLDVYSPDEDLWIYRSGSGKKRSFHCADVWQGKAYFNGGLSEDGSSIVTDFDIYDIDANIWYKGSLPPTFRAKHKSIVYKGEIWYFGGYDRSNVPCTDIDVYNPEKDEWRTYQNGINRWDFGAVARGNDLYLWSGLNANGLNSELQRLKLPVKGGNPFYKIGEGGANRSHHTSVISKNRLLLFGGKGDDKPNTHVDLFDLDSKEWSVASTGLTTRWDHTSLLYRGDVYHWGGENETGYSNDLEIYRPPVKSVRWLAGVTYGIGLKESAGVLYDDKLWFFGGQKSLGATWDQVSTGVYLDLNSSVWEMITPTGSTSLQLRKNHTATLLNGKVYIWGGTLAGGNLNTMDIYDIEKNEVANGGRSQEERVRHSATAAGDQIWYCGGFSDRMVTKVESYNTVTKLWEPGPSLAVPRQDHSGVYGNGKLFIWGGVVRLKTESGDPYEVVTNSMEVFDVANGIWSDGKLGGTARKNHSASLIGDKIYFWGGEDSQGNKLNTIDVYDIKTQNWSSGVFGGTSRSDHMAFSSNGLIYFWGGTDQNSEAIHKMDIYIAESGTLQFGNWEPEHGGPIPSRKNHAAVAYNDKIYFWGGEDSAGNLLNTMAIYSTQKSTPASRWSTAAPAGGLARKNHSGVAYEGKIYFFGGEADVPTTYVNELDVFDIDTMSWSKMPSMGVTMSQHTAVLHQGKIWYQGGVDSSGNTTNYFQVHDLDAWSKGAKVLVEDEVNERVLEGRLAPTLIARGEKIYLWGGRNSDGVYNNELVYYDVNDGKWHYIVKKGIAREGAAVASIGTKIYWHGGMNIGALVDDSSQVEYHETSEGAAKDIYTIPGPSNARRMEHAAAVWDDTIYYWGGRTDSSIVGKNTIFSFKPDGNVFTDLPAGGRGRHGHCAEAYKKKIYFWGGMNSGNYLNTMDIYDIETKTWSEGTTGGERRAYASSAILDGRIYFFGGEGLSGMYNSVDIYDIEQDKWLKGIQGGIPRSKHGGALLNGKVYLFGGGENNNSIEETNGFEIYNLNQWYKMPMQGAPVRALHTASAQEGKLYLWGGKDNTLAPQNKLSIFDIASNSWREGKTGGTARFSHTADLSDSKIYFWGGETATGLTNNLDIFDIGSSSWIVGFKGGRARSEQGSALASDSIWFFGGKDAGGTVLNTMDAYTLPKNAKESEIVSSGGTARSKHTATLYNGKAYFWGGKTGGNSILNTMDIYDFATNSWSGGSAGGVARYDHSAVEHDGKIYFWGGNSSTQNLNSVDIYDVANDSWQTGDAGGEKRWGMNGAIDNNRMYIWGGGNPQGITNRMDVYDFGTNKWLYPVYGGESRNYYAMTKYKGDFMFHGGEIQQNVRDNTLEVYQAGSGINHKPWIDNLGVEVQLFGYRDSISMNFVPHDEDGDSISVVVQYSVDGGVQWQAVDMGNVSGSTQGLQSGVNAFIRWHSFSDIVSDKKGVKLRLIPFDGIEQGTGKESNAMDIYNAGTWFEDPVSASAIQGRYGHSVSIVQGYTSKKAVFWGGLGTSRSTLDSLAIYDISGNRWSAGPTAIQSKVGHTSFYWYDGKNGEQVIVWGGIAQNQYTNDFMRYQSRFEMWTSLFPQGGTARAWHTSFTGSDNKFYIWGGEGNTGVLNTMDIFDLNEGLWLVPTSGGTARKYHSCVLYNNKAYFFGGRSAADEILGSLDIYDINQGTWQKGESLWIGLEGHVAVASGDRMFVWGGTTGNSVTDKLYIYLFHSDRWLEGPQGGRARKYHAGFANDGILYFYGGLNENGEYLQSMDRFVIPKNQN